jgi:hypothetical protein
VRKLVSGAIRPTGNHKNKYQAGELSENSPISEIFVSTSEKIRQVFLLNAYAFRDFLIF